MIFAKSILYDVVNEDAYISLTDIAKYTVLFRNLDDMAALMLILILLFFERKGISSA